MTRWHGLMTPWTWEYFLKNKEKVLGYRDMRGPSVQRMKKGDRILVYVGGIGRWVGICQVTGDGFHDNKTKCHGKKDFPNRVPVKVLYSLSLEEGVLRDSLIGKFRGTRRQKKGKERWRGWIRGSPIAYSDDPAGPYPKDGELVEKAIISAKAKPVRVEFPKHRRNWRYMHPDRVERKKQLEKPRRTRAGKKVAKKTAKKAKSTKKAKRRKKGAKAAR